MQKPELLAPAGDIEKLKTAYRYGADACYMGVKSLSMRVKIDDEGGDALEEALRIKTELGKKLYITMNIHAHESRLNFLEKELERLSTLHKKNLDPDGILVSDAGIFDIVKTACPWIPLHVSTQANILNSSAIEFWVKQGATRVVLGREVSLRELQKIRENLKKDKVKTEIEGFVHGAMCMAYSGRCLLSNFMSNRDANEGMCSHSCRWNYKVYLEEELRPGEFIPIEEDQDGTSLMSSKDMCMIEHLRDLIDAGLDSLKIEGRHKTIYYLAIATRAYREALDLAAKGKPPTPEIMDLINSIDTRGYFTGFWYGKPGAEGQKYGKKRNYNDDFSFAGVIRKIEGKQMFIEVKNTLQKGDKLDIITPNKTLPLAVDEFRDAKNGKIVEIAHPGQAFTITIPAIKGVSVGDVIRKRLNAENNKATSR
jgi:U32 family peptidase